MKNLAIASVLAGASSFAYSATSIELFEPMFGSTFSLNETGEITAPMSYVGVQASVMHDGVTNAQLVSLDDNPAECSSVKTDLDSFPAQFLVPPPTSAAVCKYSIHFLQDSAHVGHQDLQITWSADGQLANVEQMEPVMDPMQSGFGEMSMAGARVTVGTSSSTEMFLTEPFADHAPHGMFNWCTISNFAYDDPIVNTDQPGASHLHMFWGNTGVDAFTRGSSLRQSTSTTCEGGTNYLSSMWMPALFNAEGEVVLPESASIGYKSYTPDEIRQYIQVVPDGLEMLASKQTANFNKWIRLGHRYRERNGKRELLFQVFFPECVATDDGTRTGNPILRYQDMPGEASKVVNSHVSYPGHWSTRNEAGCPPTHPYRYPAPIGTISFSAMGDNPYLASDMIGEVPLESFHADYIAGIPPETNEKMLKCIKESRRCDFTGSRGQLPERFYAPNGTKVYKYDVVIYPEIDRTPFDKYFTPMMSGSQHNH